jgi:hypothetical protein
MIDAHGQSSAGRVLTAWMSTHIPDAVLEANLLAVCFPMAL